MTNDMRHLDFIRAVAEEDLRYVDVKDRQYGGSWKRRGGVGAFMMLARKWDRLENFLSNLSSSLAKSGNASNYDIFRAITEAPSGEDGTVLAEVRDLRRYLMLVEAEMMARGAVPVPSAGTDVHPFGDGGGGLSQPLNKPETKLTQHRVLDQYGEPVISEGKIYERGRSPRWLVRDKDGRPLDVGEPCMACIAGELMCVHVISLHGENIAHVKDRVATEYTALGSELCFDPSRERVAVTNTPSCGEGSFDTRMQRADEAAALAPWVVTPGYGVRKNIEPDLFEKFWRRRAPEVCILEPHVESHNIPRTLRDFYHLRGEHWILRIEKCPADAREYYPNLTREFNMLEHQVLPEWQRPLYTWNDDQLKYVLNEQTAAWHAEEAA